MDDFVPSETSPRYSRSGTANPLPFPRVLRRRLDNFFSDANIPAKADGMMWVKITLGLAVLAGNWIALYALDPDSVTFVALYLLNGLAQTFLLLNIGRDSNHNAISSVRSVNKVLNYVFDAYQSRAPLRRFQHIYALFSYAMFSLDYVFIRDFECFFFPSHEYLKRARHAMREYVILFAGKAFYLTYTLILPVVTLGKSPWLVALAFLLSHIIAGLSVSLVFQTTHTVDNNYFPSSRNEFDSGIYHIFATTADYATSSPLVRWRAGGLNHHVVHPSMRCAIWHHLILLKQLGNENSLSST